MIIGLFGYVLNVYKDDELVYISKCSANAANDLLLASAALKLGMKFTDAKKLEPMLETPGSLCYWKSYKFKTSYNPCPV